VPSGWEELWRCHTEVQGKLLADTKRNV